MAEEKFCQGCKQSHRCQDVYEQISQMGGPSVAFKVILAFLVPIVVFVGSLAVFEEILAGAIESKDLQMVTGFVLALVVSIGFVFIRRSINKGLVKNK